MAITAVRVRRSHTYHFGLDDGQPLPTQDLVRRFWVYSDTNDENPDTVRTATGIPAWGDAHPNVPASLAQDFDLSRDEDYPWRWEVDVRYQSRKLRGSNNTGVSNQDPLTITKFRISSVSGEKLVTEDQNGFPPQTTAGELITGLKIPWNELQIEITQYRSVLDAAAYVQLATYRNAVNSDTWRGFAPLTCRIASISGQDVDIYGTTYLERNLTIMLRDPDDTQTPDWRLKFLNAGYYIRNPLATTATALLDPILDPKTGMPVTKPQPIAQNGLRVIDCGPTGSEDPYWLNIEVYPQLPFAALNI